MVLRMKTEKGGHGNSKVNCDAIFRFFLSGYLYPFPRGMMFLWEMYVELFFHVATQ
jgi:hypothetical protein